DPKPHTGPAPALRRHHGRHDLGRNRRPLRGGGDHERPLPRLPHLHRRGPPLRPGPADGPRARLPLRVLGHAGRKDGVARGGLLLPPFHHKDPGFGRGAGPGLRLLPRSRSARAALHAGARHREARRHKRETLRARRPLRPGPRDDGKPQGGLARRPADAWGPDLRRRTLPRSARLYPLPPQPRVSPRRGGLRGVHAPLPRRLGPPDPPVAPLHRPFGHDLRRPRRPRRLELIQELGRGHARRALVGGAHRRGLLVLLDLPAPRQPLAGGTRRERPVRPGREIGRRHPRPARVRLQVRPRDRGDALELPPRLRQRTPHSHRLPCRSGLDPGQALDAGREGVGVAPREGHGRLRPPPLRHLVAVPALPRLPPPRGGERGDLRRRLGPPGREVRRVPAPAPGPRTLARLPRLLYGPGLPPPLRRLWRTLERRGPGLRGRPLWRRPPRLPRQGELRRRYSQPRLPGRRLPPAQPFGRPGAPLHARRLDGVRGEVRPLALPPRRGNRAARKLAPPTRGPLVRQPHLDPQAQRPPRL
ncbi:MAG: Phosphodiesterase/alkaline phosphatase D, partial [uncultured Rubrobacteraceae bacterium]